MAACAGFIWHVVIYIYTKKIQKENIKKKIQKRKYKKVVYSYDTTKLFPGLCSWVLGLGITHAL